MPDTLPLTSQMTAYERALEAKIHVNAIREGIATGREFRSANAAEFFVKTRDRLTQYQDRTHVSPDELKFLRKLAVGMKGRKKP